MTLPPGVGMDGARLTINPATRYWDVAGAASGPRSPRPRPLRPRPPSPRPPWSIEPRFMPPMAGPSRSAIVPTWVSIPSMRPAIIVVIDAARSVVSVPVATAASIRTCMAARIEAFTVATSTPWACATSARDFPASSVRSASGVTPSVVATARDRSGIPHDEAAASPRGDTATPRHLGIARCDLHRRAVGDEPRRNRSEVRC